MKKAMAITGVSLVMIFFMSLAFRPAPVMGSAKFMEGNPELPDSVAKFVQKACLDCHGEDGNGMAKSHVNLGKWNSYDTKKQASKAADMAKQVGKGSMPPGKWRKNNPDNVPTDKDIKLLQNWAAALNK
ncbi:MAG: heme-binding domain-containing protein [Bacteroidota bacterium]